MHASKIPLRKWLYGMYLVLFPKIKTDSAVRNISAYIVPLRQERDYW
jgi:hypothetical protein